MAGKMFYAIVRRQGYNTIEFMTDRIRLEFVKAEFGKLMQPIVPDTAVRFEIRNHAIELCRALNGVSQSLYGVPSLDHVDYRVFDFWRSNPDDDTSPYIGNL